MTPLKACLCTLALTIPAALCDETLKLNPLFTDHGVLQQELPVPVWGEASPNARVVVSFADQKVESKADENGNWQAVLKPLAMNREPAKMTVVSGNEEVTISDLLVGEVWVCSGQSNMGWSVGRTLSGEETAEAAEDEEFSQIRLFKVPIAGEDAPATEVNAEWTTTDAKTVSSFSATGFYFGSALQKARNIPVGLIQSANGGTNAYSWINTATYLEDPAAESVRAYFKAALENYPEAMEKFEIAKAKWDAKKIAAEKEGKTLSGRAPRAPMSKTHVKRPTGHYNAMVAPLQPYAIRGAIWYQGEANSRAPFAPEYRDLMFALVEDWRADWAAASGLERRDFPFYLVQLPNYAGGHPEGWPVIREQMLKFWQEGKNTGMVTTIDVGDANDIHPQLKKPVGERLARFARANAYGEDIVYSGPLYDSMQVDGNEIVLNFHHVGGGLVSLDEETLRHFEIAGNDAEFVPATSVAIDGNTVVLSADSIAEPRAVRYAWKNNPEDINFANREGLPATPFRTDSWEIEVSATPTAPATQPAPKAPADNN